MDLAGAVASYRLEVFLRAVALVADEVVLGKLVMVNLHDPVAGHLGDDRGAGHGDAQGVAPDDRFLRDGKIEALGPRAVDEEIIRSR